MPYSVSPRRIDHSRGPNPRKYSVTFMPAPLGREEVAELVQHDHDHERHHDDEDRRGVGHDRGEDHGRHHGQAGGPARRAVRRGARPGRGGARAPAARARRGPGPVTSWLMRPRSRWRTARSARSRARRSASKTSSASVASAPSHDDRVSATTSAIDPHPMRPARKAATPTSFPALSQAGARPPARPASSARSRQAKTSRSGGSKSRRPSEDQSMAPIGVPEATGVAERVPDGQSHVWLGKLGHRRSVNELHHRVYDRLGVNNDRDPVVIHAEQLVGLDDLEALVHEGGGVHRDLRPHLPGRMGQRLCHLDRPPAPRGCVPGRGRRWP